MHTRVVMGFHIEYMEVYRSHWPKANRVTIAIVGKMQGVRMLHTLLAEQ